MTDEKPRDLLELATLALGKKLEDVPFVTALNFDDPTLNLEKYKEKPLPFRNGDYSLKGHEDIEKGAAIFGQQLLDQADKSHINIKSLKEFENADFDGNGKVTAEEVGALLLAADMGAKVNRFGDVESEFHNRITRDEMDNLLKPDAAKAAREIAKQLLQDNGKKVAGRKTDDAEFVKTMKELLKANPAVPKARR